jgi:hypothetical protein
LPVDVNLRRLNAEIDDCNRQLQTLRRTIDLSLGEPSTEQLTQWVEQLAALCARHEFVSLYYQGLRDDERPLVLRPASPLPTARRLWELTETLAAGGDGDFLRAFDAQRGPALHDLQTRLQGLVERLADNNR